MKSRKKIEGIVLLALSALLFYLPQYMQRPGIAHGKILLAAPDLNGGTFARTVVLVVQDNGYGARGFILNRPGPTPSAPADGGPVEREKTFTLHSLDITDGSTEEIKDLALGLTSGEEFVYNLGQRARKPADYIILKGYAGWGRNQLAREIDRGLWRVTDFNRALVFETDPAKMYEALLK